MAGILDSQNKEWAEDKSKFGYRMLAKMGWTEGKGLGRQEDGNTSHIRVRKKSTNSGVGASTGAREAWKIPASVANDLDDVLKRLSDAIPANVNCSQSSPSHSKGDRGCDNRKAARGYFARRAAGKAISTYSRTDLREIFGGAPSMAANCDSSQGGSVENAAADDESIDREAVGTLFREQKKKKERKRSSKKSTECRKEKSPDSLSLNDAGIKKTSKKHKHRQHADSDECKRSSRNKSKSKKNKLK